MEKERKLCPVGLMGRKPAYMESCIGPPSPSTLTCLVREVLGYLLTRKRPRTHRKLKSTQLWKYIEMCCNIKKSNKIT